MSTRRPSPAESPSKSGSHDQAYNRDDQLKRGGEARMAQEPRGGEGSARSTKTATDPASGAPVRSPGTKGAAPNRAKADQNDGAARKPSS
ncbi:hypothetical protein [Phenylobacterium sp.]|uniref:hypothetical protein n=1 Tax=Phenylobacterium sp. TaxID=1871053 RepID=UPI00301D04EA